VTAASLNAMALLESVEPVNGAATTAQPCVGRAALVQGLGSGLASLVVACNEIARMRDIASAGAVAATASFRVTLIEADAIGVKLSGQLTCCSPATVATVHA